MVKFESGKWYIAYHDDVGIPFLCVSRTEISVWGQDSYRVKIVTLGDVEMLNFVRNRQKFTVFADRRLDVDYYTKTYGEIPHWLEEELKEQKRGK